MTLPYRTMISLLKLKPTAKRKGSFLGLKETDPDLTNLKITAKRGERWQLWG